MADAVYDINDARWTNPGAPVGMWLSAGRGWELSSGYETFCGQKVEEYTHRQENIRGEIDEVNQQLQNLPIDDPRREELIRRRQQLELELGKQMENESNLSGLSVVDYIQKYYSDKRDILAILENSSARWAVMANRPQFTKRDPNYRTLSGYIPVLSAAEEQQEKWCVISAQDGLQIAKQNIHPLTTGLSVIQSQIPMLSVGLSPQSDEQYVQLAQAYPNWNNNPLVLARIMENALCAITFPAQLNQDVMQVQIAGNELSTYAIQMTPQLAWQNPPTIWLDNETAFNGQISDLININSYGILETLGWGSNGRWISGQTTLQIPSPPTGISVLCAGKDLPRTFFEWYSPMARYVGYGSYPAQPYNLPTSLFYYDKDFLQSVDTFWQNISAWTTISEYDYTTGDEISSAWGMFQPEIPSIWPKNRLGLIAKPANAMDIYTSYWNLSKADTMARMVPYRQDQIYWHIEGNAYSITNGTRLEDRVMLSSNLSALPNYEWFRNLDELGYLNFKEEFFDPYADFTRKSNENGDELTQGCYFTGKAVGATVGEWQELSGRFEHATCWFWQDMFDKYGQQRGAWYIVPVVGYSAVWTEWYDTEKMTDMVNFDSLDVKVSIFAIRANITEDQTTKSWKAYMGNNFWQRLNQISWRDLCLPPAPPEIDFPEPKDHAINVHKCSLRRCKCLGPTMLVAKYKWNEKNDDDGVHYIPVDLPRPKWTKAQKPWLFREKEEDEE